MNSSENKQQPGNRSYAFFRHTSCEFFPCHEGADTETFNCLFCYCPLYALGKRCGGNFRYTETGIKDCTACTFPHVASNYDHIMERYGEISDVVRREDSL